MDNIAQIHSKLDKMPDAYLTQLVENQDPKATVALMVLGTRQNAAKTMAEEPATTVAQQTVAETRGLPSVAPQQNNQDPRLMAGMGSMPMTPRDSMDTPMNGIAQLPAQQMMADGGIVGFAGPEGSFVDEEGYINPRDLKYAPNYIYNSPSGRQDNPEIMGAAYRDPYGRVDINAQMQGDSPNPNTSTIPSFTGLSEEALMDMQRKRDFFDMYGYPMPEVPSSEESTALKKPSLKRMMESERALPRAIAGGIESIKPYIPFIDTQSPKELAEPAEIDKELQKRTRELLIPKDDKAVREMLSGTKDGREGYLAKRDREGLIRDKRAKVAKTAADKKAAEKAAAEKAAAEKLEAEKRARELAVEKTARKKRQRESGRDLLATSAAMLRAAEEGKSTLGVLGAGAEGREAALSRREAAEVAATEAESVQGARSDEILIKQMAATAALNKIGADERKSVLAYFGEAQVADMIDTRARDLVTADPALTIDLARDRALQAVIAGLRRNGIIPATSNIGAAPTTAPSQDFTGFTNKTVDGG